MSEHKDNNLKHRRADHPLKSLPTEVLLKARHTLVSLGGALKSRHDQPSRTKQDLKDKKPKETLKTSRSEPEFGDIRKNKHRSRAEQSLPRDYGAARSRPLSVGAIKRYDKEDEFAATNFTKDVSHHKQFESSEDICVQSRLVIPVNDRLKNQDIQVHEVNGRPRKKLSFREPEIVGTGSATLGRSHKLMGVNSLTKRPTRLSLRSGTHYSSLDGLDSDLEVGMLLLIIIKE